MKTRTVLLITLVAAVLLTASSVSRSDARTTTAPVVLSGGQYVLTLQSPVVTQPTGYRLVDAVTEDDEGSGCCCEDYLPCVLGSE
jgi:hypothetical protein